MSNPNTSQVIGAIRAWRVASILTPAIVNRNVRLGERISSMTNRGLITCNALYSAKHICGRPWRLTIAASHCVFDSVARQNPIRTQNNESQLKWVLCSIPMTSTTSPIDQISLIVLSLSPQIKNPAPVENSLSAEAA
jgi:hypothetical protein